MHFGSYSKYYDLLYKDKDYVGEAKYIAGLIRRYAPRGQTVLELGCGTAKHAELLAGDGFDLSCIEVSETMRAIASERSLRLGRSGARSFDVHAGDARSVRLGKTFDAVISLFHVVSYQVEHDDVVAMFETVRDHLSDDGVFIFDVWYGPGVVNLRPSTRVKRMSDSSHEVFRVAEPSVDMNANRVDVHYDIFVKDLESERIEHFDEVHRMRYFFPGELRLLLDAAGMSMVHSEEWLTSSPPSELAWGVTFVAVKSGTAGADRRSIESGRGQR